MELVGSGSVINEVKQGIIFYLFKKKVYPVIPRAVLQTPVSLTDPVHRALGPQLALSKN